MTSEPGGGPGRRERPPVGGDPVRGGMTQSTPVGRWEALRRISILIALYAIPAVVVVRPVSDNDIWMNLRAGRWIVAHGTVPAHRPVLELWPGEAVGGL